MESASMYIIESLIVSSVLFLYYQLVLKNKKFHTYNRFYLLYSIILSLLIPFADFGSFYIKTDDPIHSLAVVVSQTEAATERFNLNVWIAALASLVSVVLLSILFYKIWKIIRIKVKSENIKLKGFTLIETDVKQAPFSFLNNLFWRQGLAKTDVHGQKIFTHELTHIIQKHTYDKLFTQIVCCTFWINPIFWLVQKELNTIHEFLADAESIEDGDTESFAKMLLHSYNNGSYLTPSHSFFNSSIKRRLIMITSSRTTRHSYIRRIAALPIGLMIAAMLSISFKTLPSKNANGQSLIQKSMDTVPKTNQTVEEKLKTVDGYELKSKLKNKKTPGEKSKEATADIKPAPSADVIEVVVSGYELTNPAQAIIAPASPNVKQGTGYTKGKPADAVVAPAAASDVKPVTVTGYRSGKPSAAVQAAPDVREVTVSSYESSTSQQAAKATPKNKKEKKKLRRRGVE